MGVEEVCAPRQHQLGLERVAVAAAVLAVLASLTAQQTEVWRTETSFFKNELFLDPDSACPRPRPPGPPPIESSSKYHGRSAEDL